MKTQCNTMQKQIVKSVCSLSLIMVFWLFANPMHAQQNADRTISGVVTSNDGPLFGASVVLKGTTIGVSSDETGTFKFPKKLKENDVLIVSFLGYKNSEITIGNVTTFIEPFLEDIPVFIKGALLTKEVTSDSN